MKVIHKDQALKIPDLGLKHNIFIKFVSIIINFGPILAPLVFLGIALIFNINNEFFYIGYFISLVISSYWIYIVFINFYNIKVNRFEFKDDRITKPLKLIFVSDLHVEKNFSSTNIIELNKIIHKINSLNGDYLILGGDILDNELNISLLNELSKINSRKIAILGNHDSHYLNSYFYGKETPKSLIEKLKELSFEVLINSGISLREDIYLGGIKDLYTLDFDISQSIKTSLDKQFKILVSHNPEIISYTNEIENLNIDLILSGHNHAGQIKLGKLHLPMPSLRQWLTAGIYKISSKTTLLLSQGVGSSHIRTRIGTDFEILLIEIDS